MLGEELKDIWKVLSPICDKPGDVLTNAKAAAFLLKKSDQVGPFIGLL